MADAWLLKAARPTDFHRTAFLFIRKAVFYCNSLYRLCNLEYYHSRIKNAFVYGENKPENTVVQMALIYFLGRAQRVCFELGRDVWG